MQCQKKSLLEEKEVEREEDEDGEETITFKREYCRNECHFANSAESCAQMFVSVDILLHRTSIPFPLMKNIR